MKHNILVTGATGMVGAELIKTLKDKGANVSVLTRNPSKVKGFKVYFWDVFKGEIDQECAKGIDTIIHLAGEPVAAEKWTDERKKEIIESRVKSAKLLYDLIKLPGNTVKNFISASAVGIYGDRGDEILTEESGKGAGFLADCCHLWEAAANEGKPLGIRVVKIRIGIVLGKEEGSLPVMAKPIKLFAGAYLGNGKQWVPWIHHNDIVSVFVKAAEDPNMVGVYNACAPFPISNKYLTKEIAKALHRPALPFGVPEMVLKIILGEQSILPLMSTNTSAQKLLDTGFIFKYTTIEDALANIYAKS